MKYNEPLFIWSQQLEKPSEYRKQIPEILNKEGLEISWEEMLLEEFSEQSSQKIPSNAVLWLGNKLYDFENKSWQTVGKASFSFKLLMSKATNIASLVLIALFPKCPVCWAAYAGLLGGVGLSNVSYKSWYIAIPLVLMMLSIAFMTKSMARNNRFLGLYVLGAMLIVLNYFTYGLGWLNILGFIMVMLGAFFIILPEQYLKTIHYHWYATRNRLMKT